MYRYVVTNFKSPGNRTSIHPVYERFQTLEDAKAYSESIMHIYNELYIQKLCLVVKLKTKPIVVYEEPE